MIVVRQWILIRDVLPVELPIPALTVWHAQNTGKLYYPDEHTSFWSLSIDYLDISDFVNDRLYGCHDKLKDLIYEYQITNDIKSNRRHLEALKELIDDTGLSVEPEMEITTPWGKCKVKPHEYNKIDDIAKHFEFIANDLATIHFNCDSIFRHYDVQTHIKTLYHKGIPMHKILEDHYPSLFNSESYYIEMIDDLKQKYCKYHIQHPYEERQHTFKKFLLTENTRNFFYSTNFD